MLASPSSPSRYIHKRSSLRIPKRFWKSLSPMRFRLLTRRTRSKAHRTGTADRRSTQSPMKLLPEELIALICGHLTSRQDQLAFLKTCRAFRDPGYRALYAHIQVSGPNDGSSQVFNTLFHRPDLVNHVRSYSGPLYIGPPEQHQIERRTNGLGRPPGRGEDVPEGYFPTIFEHANLIRDLEITYYYPLGFGIGEQTLTLLSRMPLLRLAIHQVLDMMPLSGLLRAQSNIRVLELHGKGCNWDLWSLRPSDLPNLESLTSSVDPARLLVPGRPITSVMLQVNACTQGDEKLWRKLKRPCAAAGKRRNSNDSEEELWVKLAQSSARVVNLGINPIYYYHALERVAFYLPGIQYLCLKAHCHRISELAQTASHFPELKILDLGRVDEQPGLGSPQVWNEDWTGNSKHEIAVLFAQSQTLEVVSVWGRGSVILRRKELARS